MITEGPTPTPFRFGADMLPIFEGNKLRLMRWRNGHSGSHHGPCGYGLHHHHDDRCIQPDDDTILRLTATVDARDDAIFSLIDTLEATAQKVHQGYHQEGTWRDCPKDVCASIRSSLASTDSSLSPKKYDPY